MLINSKIMKIMIKKVGQDNIGEEKGEEETEREIKGNGEDKEPYEAETKAETGVESSKQALINRPFILHGRTYKVKQPNTDSSFYITINNIVIDGKVRPFEIFINSSNMENYSWTVVVTRLISSIFRQNNDYNFVVDELKSSFDPRGGYFKKGVYYNSLISEIGHIIENHLLEIQLHNKRHESFSHQKKLSKVCKKNEDNAQKDNCGDKRDNNENRYSKEDYCGGNSKNGSNNISKTHKFVCPICNGITIKTSGCLVCQDCNYSMCE